MLPITTCSLALNKQCLLPITYYLLLRTATYFFYYYLLLFAGYLLTTYYLPVAADYPLLPAHYRCGSGMSATASRPQCTTQNECSVGRTDSIHSSTPPIHTSHPLQHIYSTPPIHTSHPHLQHTSHPQLLSTPPAYLQHTQLLSTPPIRSSFPIHTPPIRTLYVHLTAPHLQHASYPHLLV